MVTVPMLILASSAAAIFFFFLLLSTHSSCDCPSALANPRVRAWDGAAENAAVSVDERISPTKEDVEWVRDQIRINGLHMQDNVLRKGINPRTRAQQLQDLLRSLFSLSLSIYIYIYI